VGGGSPDFRPASPEAGNVKEGLEEGLVERADVGHAPEGAAVSLVLGFGI
jgi:hypothetical protein